MQHIHHLSGSPLEATLQLSKLQAQLRKSEKVLKTSKWQTQQLLENQEKQIEQLMQEHEDLAQTFHAEASRRMAQKPHFVQVREANEVYDCLIQKESKRLINLDLPIKAMEQKIAKRVRRPQNAKKMVKNVQDQLYYAETKLPMLVMQKNKEKELVKDQHLQRESFYTVHQSMLQELRLLRKDISELRSQTLLIYEEKDSLMARIQPLKQEAAKELDVLDRAIRKFENQEKASKFIEKKLSNPIVLQSKIACLNRNAKRNAMAQDKKSKENVATIKLFEDVYNTLVTLTGQTSVDGIIQEFARRETKQFGNNTRNSHFFDEVRKLQQDIQQLQEEITNLKLHKKNWLENNERLRRELEKKIQRTSQEAKNYEDQFNQKGAIVGKCISVLDRLFKNSSCQLTPFMGKRELKHLSYLRTLKYFKSIEDQVNELLQVHSYLTTKDKHDSEISLGSHLGFSPCTKILPPISPPQITEEIVSSDDIPLEYEESKKIALDKIRLREEIRLRGISKKLLPLSFIARAPAARMQVAGHLASLVAKMQAALVA